VGLHFPDKLLFAVFLLVFFSIGLGSVLVAIGVALVTGKALLESRGPKGTFFQSLPVLRRTIPPRILAALDHSGGRLLRALPVASRAFIAGLGVFFCATTIATGRTELAAMLRALASWMEGRG